MEESEMVWLATLVDGKELSSEDLAYSDYLYGKEELFDDVWGYVTELRDIGRTAFREKYKEYKLY